MKSAVQIAREALDSELCVCGKPKKKDRPFCLRCYYKIPKELQIGLQRTFSQGFAIFYDECVGHLKIEGVIKPAPSTEKIE
jgi:hypothetical protein